MERFEYMQITSVATGSAGGAAVQAINGRRLEQWPDLGNELAKWGQEGWELTAILPYPNGVHVWVFKRRMPLGVPTERLVA